MHVLEMIRKAETEGKSRFGVELLPPLKGEGAERIYVALDPLMECDPAYINITSHREDVKYVEKEGGLLERHSVRRRPGTVGLSAAIMRRYGVEVVPHVICGGQSRYDIEDALIDLDLLGIHNVLALRGDTLRGENTFRVHSDGYAHASELVAHIAAMNSGHYLDSEVDVCHPTDCCIGVAGYPEKHAEAPNRGVDIRRLKEKVDAGAHYIVTQMSFDAAKIIAFAADCRAAGITVPIVPGIKPFSSKTQLALLPQIFHVDLPQDLVHAVEACRTGADVRRVGVEWAIAEGRELLKAGMHVLHFYTMSRTDNMIEIAKALF